LNKIEKQLINCN